MSALLKLLVLACGSGTLLMAFSSGPPRRTPGAFGEANLYRVPLRQRPERTGRHLTISNVPRNYHPGQTYQIKSASARVVSSGGDLSLRCVGFRWTTGGKPGVDERETQVTSLSGIQYITHTSAGTPGNCRTGDVDIQLDRARNPGGTDTIRRGGQRSEWKFCKQRRLYLHDDRDIRSCGRIESDHAIVPSRLRSGGDITPHSVC